MELERVSPGSWKYVRFSYFLMVGLLTALVFLHLGTLVLAASFTYLALSHLCLFRRSRKFWSLILFLVLTSALAYSLGYAVNQTFRVLPDIADQAIPSVIALAKDWHVELPFTDYDSLKDLAIDSIKGEARYWSSVAKFARGASTQALSVLAGMVVAISLFFQRTTRLGLAIEEGGKDVYSLYCVEVFKRFAAFYHSFAAVMGAQLIISCINALLTGAFAVLTHLPYTAAIVGVTFLCGLMPVVGNLISNTIVVGIALTVSPRIALFALVFLVAIHKGEYLLNSTIVGWRIRNPLWLTLLGIVIGERLMGVPGIILGPVILNYIRLEASAIEGRS
jgi:predicted PurR-regulated permease PerM